MKFKMLVLCGEPRGKCLLFPPGEFVIGRGSECHIRPNSEWVSRQHCLLRVSRGIVTMCDLGSTNGTLVNGIRVVGERQLLDGDKVQIGPLVFEARLEESILISKSSSTQLGAADKKRAEATTPVPDTRSPERDPVPSVEVSKTAVHAIRPAPAGS